MWRRRAVGVYGVKACVGGVWEEEGAFAVLEGVRKKYRGREINN